jgi:hypothetical protein
MLRPAHKLLRIAPQVLATFKYELSRREVGNVEPLLDFA